MFSRLQFISHGNSAAAHLEGIQNFLDAGGNWVQLRMKNASEMEVKKALATALFLCDKYNAKCILNDHFDWAVKEGAHGVHLGQQDISTAEARKGSSNEFIIGGTANSIDEAGKHIDATVDYLGVGPLRETSTKNDLKPVLGFDGYKEFMNELKKQEIEIPVYAIGGVKAGDVKKLQAAGVYGVAMSSSLLQAKNLEDYIAQIVGEYEVKTE